MDMETLPHDLYNLKGCVFVEVSKHPTPKETATTLKCSKLLQSH